MHKKVFTIKEINIRFLIPKCPQRAWREDTTVIKVQIFTKLNMFILCQASGIIGFYDINSCDLICYMNQDGWSSTISNIMRKQVLDHNPVAFECSDISDEELTLADHNASLEISVGALDDVDMST